MDLFTNPPIVNPYDFSYEINDVKKTKPLEQEIIAVPFKNKKS